MSEKRKPSITLVARKQGKKPMRIELFDAALWPDKFPCRGIRSYRVRVNRKWVEGHRVWTVTEVTKQLRSWMGKR